MSSVPFSVFSGSNFGWLTQKFPSLDLEEKRRKLLSQLNSIAGISLPDDAITRLPKIPLSALKDEAALKQFLEVFDWVVQEIQAT